LGKPRGTEGALTATDPKPGAQGEGPRTRQVAEYLRAYIRGRGLGAGARLPGEAEMSRTLGISRPSVREASAALSAIGLIEVAPGRRPRVGTLGARLGDGALRDVLDAALVTEQADLHQVMELRRGLEIEMAGLAAARRTPEALAALGATLEAMARVLGDREAYAGHDLQFHVLLGRATGNPLYALVVADTQQAILSNLALDLRRKAGPAELARVQALHAAILEAVARRDVAGARRAMRRHFDDVGRALARPRT
jgi:GntR family transcriptional regulator, transcriptional repressor for pyruvate dehydrogenase complex